MTMLDRVPILFARSVEGCDDQWEVWCDYCEALHVHTAGDGYHRAHCFKDSSPYLKTGYVIMGPAMPRTNSLLQLLKAV